MRQVSSNVSPVLSKAEPSPQPSRQPLLWFGETALQQEYKVCRHRRIYPCDRCSQSMTRPCLWPASRTSHHKHRRHISREHKLVDPRTPLIHMFHTTICEQMEVLSLHHHQGHSSHLPVCSTISGLRQTDRRSQASRSTHSECTERLQRIPQSRSGLRHRFHFTPWLNRTSPTDMTSRVS